MFLFLGAAAQPASHGPSSSSHLAGSAGPARETHQMGVRGTSTQFTSRNWGGYITYDSKENTDFKAVEATWIQPTVSCPKTNAWTVFWVGLDGWWDDTVEQGGTSAECVDGVPQYTTWWEMYPTNAITTVFTIKPGDQITASVQYESPTSTYVITVTDNTSGKTFTEDEQCASGLTCDRSSADVIAEDVGKFNGSYFPLADYGKVKFTDASVTNKKGVSGSLDDADWLSGAVTEASGSITYATVSALNGTGTGFSATWKHV
jgi:hypothetical protein